MSNGNGHRWSKFWWQDWDRDTGLKLCSLAAQGLWMRMLCICHEADPVGHLRVGPNALDERRLAALVSITPRECRRLLAELEENRVFSRTESGTIYSRRMVRDASASEQGKLGAKNGGNPNIIRGTVPKEERQRRFRRSDSPLKARRIFERDNGLCHWCGTPLQTDHPGPDFFQVDHVVAIRDGGGNEDANLVAACAKCNHDRARHNPTPTDPLGSDAFRPQPPEADTDSDSEAERESKYLNKPTSLSSPREGSKPIAASDAAQTDEASEENWQRAEGFEPLPGKWGAQVRRAASACRMTVPYDVVRSPDEQISALTNPQPVVALVGEVMPPEAPRRYQPHEPVRTVAEQLAILRGERVA